MLGLVGGLALLVGLSACGGRQAGAARTLSQRQRVDAVTIGLEAPERPQILIEQDVLVTVTDAGGGPVDGAEVWLAMIMPTMQMSPNEPDAVGEGHGRYHAKAIFTMSGAWNLDVHVAIRGQEYVARFQAQTQ